MGSEPGRPSRLTSVKNRAPAAGSGRRYTFDDRVHLFEELSETERGRRRSRCELSQTLDDGAGTVDAGTPALSPSAIIPTSSGSLVFASHPSTRRLFSGLPRL